MWSRLEDVDSLANLTPWQQLRSPRLPRRLTQLFVGLTVYGVSMAMMVQSFLGLAPWDVLHFGLADRLPVSFGVVVILTGLVVLLGWVPLRQMPGLGTVANAVVIGLATDWGLSWIDRPDGLGFPDLRNGGNLNAILGRKELDRPR